MNPSRRMAALVAAASSLIGVRNRSVHTLLEFP